MFMSSGHSTASVSTQNAALRIDVGAGIEARHRKWHFRVIAYPVHRHGVTRGGERSRKSRGEAIETGLIQQVHVDPEPV